MILRFRRLLTALCLFGLIPATILFCVFRLHRSSKAVDQTSGKFVFPRVLIPAREHALDRKFGSDASEISAKPSAASTNATVRHAYEDVIECFWEGTIQGSRSSTCVCKKGWNGLDCSIPDAIRFSEAFKIWYSMGLIRRRSRPRTIISGLIFNHELDLLEIRVKELGDAVDYYLVVESTYTYSGMEKPLYLRSNLSAGFLREHAHKIVPISVDFYNYDGGDPWGPENYLRTSVWYEGHRRLKNIRDDDLFIMSDADEIPSRDVVLFLKHHDGYGEPILLTLRWFLYGFFWEKSMPVDMSGVCTVAFMREVYGNDSLLLHSMRTFTRNNMSNTGTFSEEWIIQGTWPRYAGWHCSWCFDAEGIQDYDGGDPWGPENYFRPSVRYEAHRSLKNVRDGDVFIMFDADMVLFLKHHDVKLAAAQRDDGVRWGDIAEKTDIGYINSLRKTGHFFDESGPLERCDAYDAAPAYVRENAERFRWLMRP